MALLLQAGALLVLLARWLVFLLACGFVLAGGLLLAVIAVRAWMQFIAPVL